MIKFEGRPVGLPNTNDYKAALHAAMLYAQSVVQDSSYGLEAPSQRSCELLKELTTTHKQTIMSVSADYNK